MNAKLILGCALVTLIAAATSSCVNYVKVPSCRLLGTWERGDKAIQFVVYPDGRVLQKTGTRYDMGTWDPAADFSPFFPSEIKGKDSNEFWNGGAKPGGTTVAEDAMANGDPDNWLSDDNQTFHRLDDQACVPKQTLEEGAARMANRQRSSEQQKCYSYIDKNGKTIAEGPFEYASRYKNGSARVVWSDPDKPNERLFDCAISTDGQFLPLLSVPRFRTSGGLISAVGSPLDIRNYVTTALAEDLEGPREVRLNINADGQLSDEPVVFVSNDYDSKFGFIGTDGKILIDKRLEFADNFHEGLAVMMVGNRYRYIKSDGDFAFDRTFQFADSFSDGLAAFIENDLWGYIDRQGKTVIKPQFSYATGFHDGLAAVRKNNAYVFIDKTGQVRTQTKFYGARAYSDGLIPVLCSNGLWGYANKDGELLIEPRFRFADSFFEGRAIVVDTEYSGYTGLQKNAYLASKNYVMGQALAGAGEPLKARKYLKIAAESDDETISTEAKRYLEVRMLNFATPESVEAYKSILIQSEQNGYASAETSAMKAINDYPKFFQLHLALADTYLKQRKYLEADKLLQSVIQQKPDYARAYVMLSRSADDQGKRQDAIKYAKLAVEKDPLDFWVQSNKIKLVGY